MSYINTFPEVDSPEVLGLHPNADLTFRFKEVHQLLDTIVETQPKQSSGESGGKTREELVYEKCEELKETVPIDYVEDEYRAHHRLWLHASQHLPLPRGAAPPAAIDKVRSTLGLVMQGIKGEIVVTGDILDSINAINDARVPKSCFITLLVTRSHGSLPPWEPGTLALLPVTRNTGRMSNGRPHSYWLTGFFNPQGYLTAVQQEITRAHKNENWALDSVVVHAEITRS